MVLILLIFSISVFGGTQDNIYMGQKDFGSYYDAFDPDIASTNVFNNVKLQTSEKNKSYLENFISRELLYDKIEVFNNIMESSICSNADLSVAKDYFRFSHRLLALSYLYEAISSFDYTQKKLGLASTCGYGLKKVLRKCNPSTLDMKNFIINLKVYNQYEKTKYLDAKYSVKSFKETFYSGFKTGVYTDLLHYRLKKLPVNLTKAVKKTCREDTKLFKLICNEQDSMYGMNEVFESYNLLSHSNVFNYLKGKINISGCLKRYKKEMVYLEKKYDVLKRIFPFLYENLNQINEKTGPVFKLGTLREFTEKGLSLYEERIGVAKLKKKDKESKPVKMFVEKKISKETIKKMAKSTGAPKVIEKLNKKTKVIDTSEFLKSKDYLKVNKLKLLYLNMSDFKYDYLITLKLKNRLDEKLSYFLIRKNLQTIKDNDAFGSIKAPVPLIFIKYMIDYNKHKDLFTFIDVVGDKFYVKNDIDKNDKNPISLIRLENNIKTNFKWQIILY